jgi:hypothetical protein
MRLGSYGFAAALLIIAPMAWSPMSAEIVEAPPGRISCNTAAGQYEKIDISRFFAGNKVTGRFQFLADARDRGRAPVAGYIFRFHNGETIEAHVMADPRNPRSLFVQVALSGAESQTIARTPRGEPVEVTANVASGILTIATANRSKKIPIGARKVIGVEASCQSGHFEIELQTPPSG